MQVGGQAALSVVLPIPKDAGPQSLPGTVNLVRNPSLESATVLATDWSARGAGSIARVADLGWQGGASLRVTVPGGTAGAGAQVATLGALGWTGNRTLLGSVYVFGALPGLGCRLVALYGDGTVGTGDAADVPADLPDGWVRATCALEPDPAKRLDQLLLAVERIDGTAPAAGSFWLDAAQVEEDRGYGHTPYAIGQYGPPYHAWWGAAHLSPSLRDGIPLDARQAGKAGQYAIKATLWRSNAGNDRLEDLSAHVVAATVSADRTRDVAWTMTLRMTDAGWRRLRPWDDWLAPVLAVTDAAGAVREGQLGHYVVLPSAADHLEHTSEWDVDCRSAEYLLGVQGFDGKLKVEAGTRLTKAARFVLEAAALGGQANGRARFRLPDVDRRAEDEFEFTPDRSKLSIVNELLEAAGCLPLAANRIGVLTSDLAKDKGYKDRQPVRLWAANFDPADDASGAAVAGWARRLPASTGEVVGPVRQLPRLGNAENEVVVLTTDARRPRRKGTASIDDPSNPISVRWTNRRRRTTVRRRLIPDDATARELAQALAEQIGTQVERVELTVAPDPSVDLLNEVVYLAVYRLDGGPAAVGRYRVLGVEYGFTPDSSLMKLTLGFVHGVAELSGGSPLFYWDSRTQSYKPDDGAPIVLALP